VRLDWIPFAFGLRNRHTLWQIFGSAGLVMAPYWIFSRAYLPAEAAQLAFVRLQEIIMYILLSGTVLLLLLGVSFAKWRGLAVLGLFLILVVDLRSANRVYLHTASTSQYYPLTPSIAQLRADPDDFRIVSLRRSYFATQMRANLLAVFGLYTIGGYDSVYLQRYKNFLHQIDLSGALVPETISLSTSSVLSPLLDLLNVKYIAPDDCAGVQLTHLSTPRCAFISASAVARAWLVARAETLPCRGCYGA
jgi:hypothetical protein